MTARTLLEVLLKFWGVVMLASTAGSLPAFFMVVPSSAPEFNRSQTFGFAVGMLIHALAAICLLFFARPLSRLLMPGGEAERLNFPADGLLEAGLITLGVFFLVSGFQLVAVVGLELLRAQTWVKAGAQESAWANQRVNFFSGAAELLAGYLVLRFRQRLPGWFPGSSERAA